jgi:putative ABC transport system substrate-binding protein
VKRREFITLAGGAAIGWPLVALAQQTMPVVGILDSRTPEAFPMGHRNLRQGLKEAGFVEGENVKIEYRWGEDRTERVPELAADLVRRRVAVIATTGGEFAAFAVKAATSTIPIVFLAGGDPVRQGLVSSIARPEGNLTGVSFFAGELAAKRLELVRALVPGAARVAVLVDPSNSAVTQSTLKDAEEAARSIGVGYRALKATNAREIDEAFASARTCRCPPRRGLTLFQLASGSVRRCRRTFRHSSNVRRTSIRRSRWADQLRRQYSRCLSSTGHLSRPYPEGHQTR